MSIDGGKHLFSCDSSKLSGQIILGSTEVVASSGVGEDAFILQYAMSLVAPQPVQFLQVGNNQTDRGRLIPFKPASKMIHNLWNRSRPFFQ